MHVRFPGGAVVKNQPVNAGDTRSLSQEDPLEKEMATHSNILAWEIPWTEEAGGLQSIGLQQLGVTKQLSMFFTATSSSSTT